MERKIFNQPIRKGITDEFYPDKMNINEFESHIMDSFSAYKQNMINLGSPAIDEKYIDYDLIYLAALVGENEISKNKIINYIHKQIKN